MSSMDSWWQAIQSDVRSRFGSDDQPVVTLSTLEWITALVGFAALLFVGIVVTTFTENPMLFLAWFFVSLALFALFVRSRAKRLVGGSGL